MAVQSVCPTCGARCEQWCFGRTGRPLLTLHPARYEAVLAAYQQGVQVGATEVVKRLTQMHYGVYPGDDTGDPSEQRCAACDVPWPCPTLGLAAQRPGEESTEQTAVLSGGPLDGELRHVTTPLRPMLVGDASAVGYDEESGKSVNLMATARYDLVTDDHGRPRFNKHGQVRYAWRPAG